MMEMGINETRTLHNISMVTTQKQSRAVGAGLGLVELESVWLDGDWLIAGIWAELMVFVMDVPLRHPGRHYWLNYRKITSEAADC